MHQRNRACPIVKRSLCYFSATPRRRMFKEQCYMAKVTDDGREKYSSTQTIGIIMKHIYLF